MARKYFQREVLPVTALVIMECANVGLNTLFKAATLKGMSFHVFIVYSYGLAALLLLPSLFCSFRSLSLLDSISILNFSSNLENWLIGSCLISQIKNSSTDEFLYSLQNRALRDYWVKVSSLEIFYQIKNSQFLKFFFNFKQYLSVAEIG